MHGGVFTAVPGHPETPCPFGSANDDPNDAQLKKNADAFVKSAVGTIMSSRAWTPHSAIFVVADEGDFSGNVVNGGWASPAGCCDSPVLPAGDPDINVAWPGGVFGGGLVPAVVIDPSGPRHYVNDGRLPDPLRCPGGPGGTALACLPGLPGAGSLLLARRRSRRGPSARRWRPTRQG